MPSKRNYYKTAGKVANVATKALKIALMTKRLLNVEYKHIDTNSTTITPGATGAIYSMNSCAEGDGSGNRNGLSLRMKSLYLKVYFQMHASATASAIRWCVVLDKSPNSNIATYSDIFESNSIVSQTNNKTNHRFRVLSDNLLTMSGSGEENGSRNVYKQLNHVVKYSSGGGTDGDLEKNQILLCIVSNEATNTPSFNYSSRVRFIDN